ncbi:hypothetical protein BJY04DRAFT_216444 [Aspergillus karnatakaensis]|uniref:SIMPL domain-containing protein n=1 Tax=Aspergillus karnatakaensis TaxID=1810916 RepID=UPI003CCDF827
MSPVTIKVDGSAKLSSEPKLVVLRMKLTDYYTGPPDEVDQLCDLWTKVEAILKPLCPPDNPKPSKKRKRSAFPRAPITKWEKSEFKFTYHPGWVADQGDDNIGFKAFRTFMVEFQEFGGLTHVLERIKALDKDEVDIELESVEWKVPEADLAFLEREAITHAVKDASKKAILLADVLHHGKIAELQGYEGYEVNWVSKKKTGEISWSPLDVEVEVKITVKYTVA